MRKKWMKVSHVIRSLALLQRQEVKNLKHAVSYNMTFLLKARNLSMWK